MRRDPMLVLPPELIERMLGFCSFRSRVVMSGVSKHWARFIRRQPRLWRHLEIRSTGRRVPLRFISRTIDCARSRAVDLDLANVEDDSRAISSLVRSCRVEELTYTAAHAGQLDESIFDTLVAAPDLRRLYLQEGSLATHNVVRILFQLRKQLHALACDVAPGGSGLIPHSQYDQLRSLELRFHGPFRGQELVQSVGVYFLALEELTIEVTPENQPNMTIELQHCRQLRSIKMQMDFSFVRRVRLPPSLTSFDVGDNSKRAIFYMTSLVGDDEEHIFELPCAHQIQVNNRSYGSIEFVHHTLLRRSGTIVSPPSRPPSPRLWPTDRNRSMKKITRRLTT
jgi:hypothetical protein